MRNTNFSVGSSLVLLKPDGNHNWVKIFPETKKGSKPKTKNQIESKSSKTRYHKNRQKNHT